MEGAEPFVQWNDAVGVVAFEILVMKIVCVCVGIYGFCIIDLVHHYLVETRMSSIRVCFKMIARRSLLEVGVSLLPRVKLTAITSQVEVLEVGCVGTRWL